MFRKGNKHIIPISPYQHDILTGNRVAHFLMWEEVQFISKNNYVFILFKIGFMLLIINNTIIISIIVEGRDK